MEANIRPVQLGTQIDPELFRRLKISAASSGRTMRQVLEHALRDHFEQHNAVSGSLPPVKKAG